MTSKIPPIPPEQRTAHSDGHTSVEDVKDAKGNADLNLEEQGRYGNLEQNVNRVQHKVQDR